MTDTRCYELKTGLIDLDLLKSQTETVGKVSEDKPITDEERADLEGLWEMLHQFIDQMEEQNE